MNFLQIFIFSFVILIIGCSFTSVAGESLEEEKKRIKSLVLNEGQRSTITCPTGKVMRIKTAQYRLTGSKNCPAGVSTCRNNCPGSFISENLAKRCDLKSRCPIVARPVSQRDSCSNEPEPLAILYTCNDSNQAKGTGNPSESYMEILQSPMCGFRKFRRFCEFWNRQRQILTDNCIGQYAASSNKSVEGNESSTTKFWKTDFSLTVSCNLGSFSQYLRGYVFENIWFSKFGNNWPNAKNSLPGGRQ